jgi:hypothetical protein
LRVDNNGYGCKDLIEEMSEFMVCKKNSASSKVIKACADLVVELFFCIGDYKLYEEQKVVYQYIVERFRCVGLKIENYVSAK